MKKAVESKHLSWRPISALRVRGLKESRTKAEKELWLISKQMAWVFLLEEEEGLRVKREENWEWICSTRRDRRKEWEGVQARTSWQSSS